MNTIPKAWKSGGDFIFVSYSHRDSPVVHDQIQSLQDSGVHVYYDEGIEPGADWPDELANAIADCSCFLVFLSDNSLASRNVRNEINYAISKERKILAVYLVPCDLPPGLAMQMGTVQAIHRHELSSDHFLEKLRASLGIQGVSSARSQARIPAKKSLPVKSMIGIFCVLALCAGAVFLVPKSSTDPSALSFESDPPAMGQVSADLRLLLQKPDGNVVPLEDGAFVSPQDGYRIEGTLGTRGWLYIYQIDSSGTLAWLFPENSVTSFSQGQNPVEPGQDFRLPSAGNYYLDDIPGIEHVTIVFCAAPWTELEESLINEAARVRSAPVDPMGFTTRGVAGIREDSPSGPNPSSSLTSEKDGVVAKQIWFHHTAAAAQ